MVESREICILKINNKNMRNKYTYVVEGLDSEVSHNSLTQSIIDEANSEVRQMELTVKINKAANPQLKKVFAEHSKELEATLKPLGVQFEEARQSNFDHNGLINEYFQYFTFDNRKFRMTLIPVTDKHDDTKYEVCEGRYIVIYKCVENGYNGEKKSLEEFIKSSKSALVRHYKNN